MISTDKVRQKIRQILNALDCSRHEISAVIADDAFIRKLNKQYRHIDKPTNVLSFPMLEGDFSQVSPGLLGDLVISGETAQKEASRAGITLDQRMSQLLIHGILHLLGFDHETGETDAQKMMDKSLELLRKIEDNQSLTSF